MMRWPMPRARRRSITDTSHFAQHVDAYYAIIEAFESVRAILITLYSRYH